MKIKTMFATILAVMVIIFVSGGAIVASAETAEPTEPPATEQTDTNEQTDDIEQVAAEFVEWLKATFGEEYQEQYDKIIQSWGSIENYLLQFGEELPKQYQSGWNEFVSWLGEYAPVWAPVLAVIMVAIIYLIGKKRFDAIVNKVVDRKTAAIGAELNKQSKAQAAQNRAIKALLGNGDKFKDNAKELEESAKELTE